MPLRLNSSALKKISLRKGQDKFHAGKIYFPHIYLRKNLY